MPADLAYGDLVEKARLDEKGRALGLNNPSVFETYIMNFEIHKLLSHTLRGCVHGGMAVPFYLESKHQRLSRDVDLYVFEDVSSVERRMDLVTSSLHGRDMRIRRHIPVPERASAVPLLTYYASYSSAYGDATVKIDILCDPSLAEIPQKTFLAGTHLRHFDTRHDVTALDAGALMADKLTSLSLNTLGYVAQKSEMINKQIYDIGCLLLNADRGQIVQAATAYKLLLNRMGRYPEEYGDDNPIEPSRIAADSHESTYSLVRGGPSYLPSKEFFRHFSAFKGIYLGNMFYTEREHTEDLLMISLFAKRMAEYINGNISAMSLAESHHSTQQQLRAIKSDPDKKAARQKIMATLSPDSTMHKVGELSLDRLYLLSEIESARAASNTTFTIEA